MYDIKFLNNENIELISDNTIVYTDKERTKYSSIVTNKRYLILDYPGQVHNSMEDLHTSGRLNYIRKKEVIFSIDINKVTKIVKDKDYDKIFINNGEYILINDNEIINYLKRKI